MTSRFQPVPPLHDACNVPSAVDLTQIHRNHLHAIHQNTCFNDNIYNSKSRPIKFPFSPCFPLPFPSRIFIFSLSFQLLSISIILAAFCIPEYTVYRYPKLRAHRYHLLIGFLARVECLLQ